MSRRIFTMALFMAATMLLAAAAESANAQGGGRRGGRGGRFGFGRITHQIEVVQLPEVETALTLTEDQIAQIEELEEEFDDERDAAGIGGRGGRRELSDEDRAARDKFNADYAAKLNALLQEPQVKRLQEVYVQVNGTNLLTDAAMATLLALTDEQKEQLNTVQDEQRQAMMDADFDDLTREEAASKMAELTKARGDAMLAVLNDEQKKQFEDMKGEALEIDLSQLRGRGFGGRGGRGGNYGGNDGGDGGSDGAGAGRPAADDGA